MLQVTRVSRFPLTPLIYKRSITIPGLSSLKKSSNAQYDQEYIIRKKLNHPQALIYNIIKDVTSYNEFIPYCTKSFINEFDSVTKQPSKGGFRVGFQNFDEEFTCELICTEPKQVISKSITDTLFKVLYSEWNIIKLNETQCEVKLVLKYGFKSLLYNKVSSMFANKISEIMLKLFEQRAIDIRKKEMQAKGRL